MMNRLMSVPPELIARHKNFSWNIVSYGIEKGWLQPSDAILIVNQRVNQGLSDSDLEIELSMIEPTHTWYILEKLSQLTQIHQPEVEQIINAWMCLSLLWLWQNKERIDEPLEKIELIYAELAYPEIMIPIVRYMSPIDGYRPQDHTNAENLKRIYEYWWDIIENCHKGNI
jgi:hypothetical protein